jgi:hypothetical protein
MITRKRDGVWHFNSRSGENRFYLLCGIVLGIVLSVMVGCITAFIVIRASS